MGLDIYAYAVRPGWEKQKEFYYWRKHHELLKWCERLAISRGFRPFRDGCAFVELLAEDVVQLDQAIRAGELPDFYDLSDRWRDYDLKFIEKAVAALAKGLRIELMFSW